MTRFIEHTELPFMDPPVLAAIGYLAVVAYPDNTERRDQLVEALKSWYLRSAKKAGQKVVSESELELPARDMRRRLAKAQNIIWGERFPASLAASEILRTKISKGSALRISGEESVLAACDKYADLSQKRTHFYERAWLPSLQVLHLVLPLYNYWFHEVHGERVPLGWFIADPHWVVKAVQQSALVGRSYLDSGIIKSGSGVLARIPQIRLTLVEPD